MRKIIIFLVFFLFVFFQSKAVFSVSLDEVEKELSDLKKTFSEINSANKTNEATLSNINKQLQGIKVKVNQIESAIDQKKKEVKEGEKVLVYQKELLNARAKSYYKNIGKNTLTLVQLLLSDNLSVSLRNFFYGKTLVDEDRRSIVKIVMYIKGIEEKKIELETEQVQLTALKADVEKQSNFLAGEVAKTKKYLGELQSKIASLTAQQQQILAQKLAGLNISRSANTAGRCDSDLTNGRDPGFSPKFAFFTFGVPNRIGLNQYGAWGRAKQGQNETQILQAYYNYDEIKKWDTNIDIRVDGLGTYKLDDYVKRLYEIPDSWTDNNLAVLKSQAIAARSYVLAYTNNGQGSICSTEYCQVVKSEPKGGNWDQAVNQTEGQVMVKGGSPIKAWFSSTHGGYIFSSGEIGWSGTDWTKHANDFSGSVNSFDDLKNNAYDKESPWFYCDWGSRGDSKTAWLRPQEVADIVNVILLARKDSGMREHLYQPDQPNPIGKETWNADRVRQELGGSAYSTIENVSVNADFGSGRTTSVNVSGDGKNDSFSMNEFKDFFNLRAPANIQIVGPLYNVEKR